MRWSLIAATIAFVTACGSGDNTADSPGAAAKQYIEQASKGQFGKMWEHLVPAQQAVVGRTAYVECNQGDNLSVQDIEVQEDYPESLTIPEMGMMETTAVTIVFRLGDRPMAITMHVIEIDGRFHWSLSPEDIETYKAGRCP